MTTVTTEAIAGVADLKAGYTLGHADVAILKTISAELLAVREAQSEAVGMQYRVQVPNVTGWSLWHNGDGDKYREHYEVQQRLVYAAPPAPAVPDDITGIIKRFQHQCDHLSDWHHIDEHSCKVDRRDLMTVTEFLNACRAAMLQPVSQGCAWTYDEHDYKWDSACGEAWLFTDGGPEDNGVKFCQGCGKLVALPAAPTPTKAGE